MLFVWNLSFRVIKQHAVYFKSSTLWGKQRNLIRCTNSALTFVTSAENCTLYKISFDIFGCGGQFRNYLCEIQIDWFSSRLRDWHSKNRRWKFWDTMYYQYSSDNNYDLITMILYCAWLSFTRSMSVAIV